jgi:hypothetical protein
MCCPPRRTRKQNLPTSHAMELRFGQVGTGSVWLPSRSGEPRGIQTLTESLRGILVTRAALSEM